MTPIVTQVLVKKKTQSPQRSGWLKTPPPSDTELYRKDVAGFLIFLVVVFTVLTISLHA